MISLVYYFWCIKHLTSSHDGCLFHWTNYPCIAVKLSKITRWSSWMPHAQSLAHLVSLAIFFQGKSGLLKADIFKFTTLLRRSKKNAAKREFFLEAFSPDEKTAHPRNTTHYRITEAWFLNSWALDKLPILCFFIGEGRFVCILRKANSNLRLECMMKLFCQVSIQIHPLEA